MTASTWSGALTFGAAAVAVRLAPATKRSSSERDVSFRRLHRECGHPLTAGRRCPAHGDVAAGETVLGWEVAAGQFVIVEPDELADLESPACDPRTIEIDRFVKLADVDSAYLDRTYLVVPSPAYRRPYKLVLEALRVAGAAGMGRFSRGSQLRHCLIRPRGGALVLQTMFLAEDVYPQLETEQELDGIAVTANEVDVVRAMIDGLVEDFAPGLLTSEYRRRLRDLLEAKLRGEPVRRAPQAPPAVVDDLMAALRARRAKETVDA